MSEQTLVKFKPDTTDEISKKKIPCLIVMEGINVGEVFQIEKAPVLIGRDPKCEIRIWEEGISRQHCKIERNDGSFILIDLGSTNGTTVNGEAATQVVLAEGDKIRLGEVLLRFSFQDALDVAHQEAMREMALRDPLTKVFNRRHFMDMIYKEINYATRVRQPLSVILLDVDYFKRINDNYGHQAGDVVLQTIAQRLSKELRVYDALARFGGEEFVVMLRGTTLENGLLLAERLRKLVENLLISYEGKTIPVTISLGVATLDPDKVVTADDLIKEADQYMYKSRNKGRNCVSSIKDS